MMSTQPQARRLFTLDVLRGVAVLLVVVRHMAPVASGPENFCDYVFAAVHHVGWIGVDLFFVLSGFLISSLLFKEHQKTGELKVGRFWLRRGFKIWPSYFVAYGLMVLLCCLDDVYCGQTDRALERLSNTLPNSLFIQNYYPAAVQWPNSWSLAIEEHFYLALPVILLAMIAVQGRRHPNSFQGLFAGCAALCLLVLSLRLAAAWGGGQNLYFPTHLRADSLTFGVMLGYLYCSKRRLFDGLVRRWPAVLGCSVALFATFLLLPNDSATILTVGLTLLFLCFGGLVLLAAGYPTFGHERPKIFKPFLRPLALIGLYSYTIYLAQAVVTRLPGYYTLEHRVARLIVDSDWTDRFLFLFLSIILGVVLAHLIERPALRLRERLLPVRRASERSAAEAPPGGGQAGPVRVAGYGAALSDVSART